MMNFGREPTEREKQVIELNDRMKQMSKARENNDRSLYENEYFKKRNILTLTELENTGDVITYKQVGRLYVKKNVEEIKNDIKKNIVENEEKIKKCQETRENLSSRIKNTKEQLKEIDEEILKEREEEKEKEKIESK